MNGAPRQGDDAGSWAVSLLMTPGSSTQLVPVINFCLVVVMAIMGYTAYTSSVGAVQLHCSIMAALALGLLVTINWFVVIYNEVKAAEGAAEAEGASASDRSSTERGKID